MSINAPRLLTDEQMKRFIAEGFLILNADFSEAFHRNLQEQLNQVYEQEGNPGNNLLPRIRELQQVFDHPTVTGALTSVLGRNYMLHAHRHGHFNANPEAGSWHKDSYWGYKKMRHHHSWWAMVMYFPQDTPAELGPTSVVGGTHLYETRRFDSEGAELEALASGPAGTFALIHYDIWHRSTPNLLNQPRYMLKFEFMRTEAPNAPTWDNRSPEWSLPANLNTPIATHEPIWEEHWNWLNGKLAGSAGTVEADAAELARLGDELSQAAEPAALDAAYALARAGRPGVEVLLEKLQDDRSLVSRAAAYGLSVAGADAVDGLTAALGSDNEKIAARAVFALGELRHLALPAVPALTALLDSPSARVRQAVVETLGMLDAPHADIVNALIRGLQDADTQVRFMSGLALCRLGPAAAAAIPQLEAALSDENRYVRAHASEALYYIGTPEAKDVLIRFLLGARWCPTTTPESTFYP